MLLQISEPYAPFQEISLPSTEEKGIRLLMKREDLSHEHISGNKWRKLKYHLLAAHSQQKKMLVTYGGAYSNHLLATAAAGEKYGFATHAFVRGEQVSNYVLDRCLAFGMELQFVSRTEYKDKEGLYAKYFGSNRIAFQIPEGGGGLLGEQGVAEVMTQTKEWDTMIKESKLPIQLFCSVGTGSTLRGLLRGIEETSLPIKAHGVVVLKGAEAMAEEFSAFDTNNFCLHHSYHFGGYAKATGELVTYQKKFASQTGILIDHVYEAKMMWAIEDLLSKNYFQSGSTLVAMHNGGTWNLEKTLFG
jgi:1-aminocyclopropane-1-carboxylate deaminase